MRNHMLGATLLGLTVLLGLAVAKAAAPQAVTVTAQCTTDSTGLDGRRAACDSQVQKVTAPDGYVLAKETAKGGLSSGNGSEQECRVRFTDNVEVIPGLPQPRSIELQAHARSPKGHASGRGWAVCSYSVNMVPLPPKAAS